MSHARIVGRARGACGWLLSALLAACGGGGGGDEAANQAPIANAGPDQTVASGALVTLTGAGSNDPDGSIASYAWTQTAGPGVTLTTGAAPTFTAPTVTANTVLTFSLQVTDNRGATSASADTVSITVTGSTAGTVPLNGRITYQRVPFSPVLGTGLAYANQQPLPARGIRVEAVTATGAQTVVATGVTNLNGEYQLTVPANASLAIRAVAELASPAGQVQPRWLVNVRDSVEQPNGDFSRPAPHTFTGSPFNSNSPGNAQNVAIPSGVSVTGQATGTRAAAPFAILDTVRTVITSLLVVEPNIILPPLDIDWGPNNPGGETFYTSDNVGPIIVLSAALASDTDEYDQHVIAHEFGHYIEDNFSRADSIGGPHAQGDSLDIRVAFGEGFGYAFAAMMLQDPVVRDSVFFQGAQRDGFFNVEDNTVANPGWFSEATVWTILWDLFDTTQDANDTVTMGFVPLWQVLRDEQLATPALTSIFSFITELKANHPTLASAIDQIVGTRKITAAGMDVFGSGEQNLPDSGYVDPDVRPIYTTIVRGETKTVRSVPAAKRYNALSNRRFLRFTATDSQPVTVVITGPLNNSGGPDDAIDDSDVIVWHRGFPLDVGMTPLNTETVSFDAEQGETYIIETYHCGNADCSTDPPVAADISVSLN